MLHLNPIQPVSNNPYLACAGSIGPQNLWQILIPKCLWKMAKTKFDMVGNIVEMSEKNDFGCQKDLHPRLRPTIGAKQGKKMKEKTENCP